MRKDPRREREGDGRREAGREGKERWGRKRLERKGGRGKGWRGRVVEEKAGEGGRVVEERRKEKEYACHSALTCFSVGYDAVHRDYYSFDPLAPLHS